MATKLQHNAINYCFGHFNMNEMTTEAIIVYSRTIQFHVKNKNLKIKNRFKGIMYPMEENIYINYIIYMT
jgi:hypothetical protein